MKVIKYETVDVSSPCLGYAECELPAALDSLRSEVLTVKKSDDGTVPLSDGYSQLVNRPPSDTELPAHLIHRIMEADNGN